MALKDGELEIVERMPVDVKKRLIEAWNRNGRLPSIAAMAAHDICSRTAIKACLNSKDTSTPSLATVCLIASCLRADMNHIFYEYGHSFIWANLPAEADGLIAALGKLDKENFKAVSVLVRTIASGNDKQT